MKILFDQRTPTPLRRFLDGHEVHTVFEKGWDRPTNGDVLAVSILNGYEILISTDQNLRHQQELERIRLGIVLLMTTSWPRIRQNTPAVVKALEEVQASGLIVIRRLKTSQRLVGTLWKNPFIRTFCFGKGCKGWGAGQRAKKRIDGPGPATVNATPP